MKYKRILHNLINLTIIIFLCCSVFSCKNDKKGTTQQNNNNSNAKPADPNDFIYVDSATNEVAVLVFGENGKTEYKVSKQDKIFQKTKNGLEYRYISRGEGKIYPKPGDVITVLMTYKTEKDSLVFSTKNVSDKFQMELQIASHTGGCIEEAFGMLREGDSAVFRIDANNFYTKTQNKILPYYFKKGDKIIFNIKMQKLASKNEFVKNNSEQYKYYLEQEKNDIERVITDLNLPCRKLTNGLSIITIEKGNGSAVNDGNTVTIDYTASFIDGTVFDSSIERNETFSFKLGQKQVIEGLEEGVKNLKIGDHALLIIPFNLAYGDKKMKMIPPFSTLIFEIKIINAK